MAQWQRIYLPNVGDVGLIPGSRRSLGEGNGNLPQYFCLGNPTGQRSLAGYSPWGHKRVRHNLATKQQQQFLYLKDLSPALLKIIVSYTLSI